MDNVQMQQSAPGDMPQPPAPVGDPAQTPPPVREPDVVDPSPVPDAPMIARGSPTTPEPARKGGVAA